MSLAPGWRICDVAARRDSGEPRHDAIVIQRSIGQSTQEGDAGRVRIAFDKRELAALIVNEADQVLALKLCTPGAQRKDNRHRLQLTNGGALTRG